jgi:hypothetical protein
MEGNLDCPENYSRVTGDSERMGQNGLPSTLARSPVLGDLAGLGTKNAPGSTNAIGRISRRKST